MKIPGTAVRIILRRYHAAALIIGGILLGGAALFSSDGEFFPTQPHYPNRLALTFDDGPHLVYTEKLLALLRRERVAATFFVVGKQAERYPALLEALVKNGHEVANHTYHHQNLTTLSPAGVAAELNQTRFLLERAAKKPVRFFRPPGGQYDPKTIETASRGGYRIALWTVFPKDHSGPSPQVIHDRVMSAAADGGVVLLHSGVESTLEALPRIIHDLRAKGFQFLTLSEMVEAGVDSRTLAVWCPSLKAGDRGRRAEGGDVKNGLLEIKDF